MNMMLSVIFTLLLMEPVPESFTESQSRDIGCVAVLSIMAEEQQRDALGANAYPDVHETGPRWAAMVRDRIAVESGQSAETIRMAIWDAVKREQAAVRELTHPKLYVDQRMDACLPVMQAELGSESAAQ